MPYNCNSCGHVFEPTVGLFCADCCPEEHKEVVMLCRNGCGIEVTHDDQHILATPDGDAWMCAPPSPRKMMGRSDSMDEKTRAAIEADKLVVGRAYGRIVGHKVEHIPAGEIIVFTGPADPGLLDKTMEMLWHEFNRNNSGPGARPQQLRDADRNEPGVFVRELARVLGYHDDEPPPSRGQIVEAVAALMAIPHPMYLTCPKCDFRHIDDGQFATKPHHTHACQNCGLTWRPMVASTVGVKFLPGFKNDPSSL